MGDECQSLWNGNPTKSMVMLRMGVEVSKILTTNDDDDDDNDDDVDNDWWWW